MKKLILYLIPITLLFASCEYMPYADFSASTDFVSVGEYIYFDNYSDHAVAFDWDFGDGYYSSLANPSHTYSQPGTYRVTLTAYGNGDDYDQAFVYITVTGGATLEITVREWREDTYYGPLIGNAEVTLYETEYDFYNFVNPVISATTDYDGKVVFEGLEPKAYYIDVYNSKYNNELLYFDDVNFVRTANLVDNAYNTFTAYVDYAPVSMKSTKRVRVEIETDSKRTAPK